MTIKQARSVDERDADLRQALRSLPELKAPPVLLPRVMDMAYGRVGLKSGFWHRWRWLTGTAAAIMTAAIFWRVWQFYETSLVPIVEFMAGVCHTIVVALSGPLIGIGPDGELNGIIFMAAGLLLIMYFTCIGLGTFVYRAIRR
jgi:hypothetical protein